MSIQSTAVGSARAAAGWRGLALGTALAAVVGALCVVTPAEANVYKWKDTQGRVHYTDRPPPPDGTLLAIEPIYSARPRGATGSGGPAPSSSLRPRLPDEDAPPPGTQAALQQAVASDVATARSEQCKEAKERYDNYVRARRLFREGEKGERVYLTDAELETARVNAKREMDEACKAST